MRCAIWCHSYNLKNVKKHPWRSATFSTKSNTPSWVFFTFSNCAHGTKSRNVPNMFLQISLDIRQFVTLCAIPYYLYSLKKHREKHPWRSVAFSFTKRRFFRKLSSSLRFTNFASLIFTINHC